VLRESASFPRAMRFAGWFLACTTVLYPVDVALERQARHEFAQSETALDASAGGMRFDLSSMAIRCSAIRWAGAWAGMLSVWWLVCAMPLTLSYRRRGAALARSSMFVLAGVAAGVMIVLGTLLTEATVRGS
jgi:hypothetical protein